MEEKNKKNNWWIWILGLILLIIILVAGGVYMIWKMIGNGIDKVVNNSNNIQNEQQWQKNIDDLEKKVNSSIDKKDYINDKQKEESDIEKIDDKMNSVSPDDFNQDSLSDKEMGLE